MTKCYLKFCQQYRLQPIDPEVSTILAYLEYLAQKLVSPKSIQNYWASVKFFHWIHQATFRNKQHPQVQLMLRAIPLTKRHTSTQKQPLQKHHLSKMCYILDQQGDMGLVIKCALLLGFNGFLRASNLCIANTQAFDPHRHFSRQDVINTPHGLLIKLKWAKNMQTSLQPEYIPIPHVQPIHIDPVSAFNNMCSSIPAPAQGPLLVLPGGSPLTITKLRAVFNMLCNQVQCKAELYSLHSLRRGGASHTLAQGAHHKDIQRHGAWSSASFWDYIAHQNVQDSSVYSALAH